MAGEGFTILHASDFQLDTPLGGLRWIPDAIEEAVRSAPEDAALRVFDLAIEHNVDMLALTGNLLCPKRSSARSLSFILRQFTRMHEHGIPVAWATGVSDPLEAWPSSVRWPDSSIRFDRGAVDRRLMRLGGVDVEVLGCGGDAAGKIHPTWFHGLSRNEHQLVVGGGTVETFNKLEAAPLWLLGGRSYRAHLVDGNADVFYAGLTQGRCLADSGSRGAQLIHVNEQTVCEQLDCAAIGYERISIDAKSIRSVYDLELLLLEYATTNNWPSDRVTLVEWDINCSQSASFFHNSNMEFMRWKKEFARHAMTSATSVFTIGVNVHRGQHVAQLTEGDNLLSDYLFALESLRENGWSEIELKGASGLEFATNDWARVDEDLNGLRTLDDAAHLGELLLGRSDVSVHSLTDNDRESEAA
jgi:hypothetical protein